MALLTSFRLTDHLPATFTAPGLNEAQFLALCEKYPDCTLEYTADGTVIVMPPTDPENGDLWCPKQELFGLLHEHFWPDVGLWS